MPNNNAQQPPENRTNMRNRRQKTGIGERTPLTEVVALSCISGASINVPVTSLALSVDRPMGRIGLVAPTFVFEILHSNAPLPYGPMQARC